MLCRRCARWRSTYCKPGLRARRGASALTTEWPDWRLSRERHPLSTSVGFLGPEGSFTHEPAVLACRRLAWPDIELIPLESSTAVVAAVADRHMSAGVLPVATSLRGVLEREIAAMERMGVRELMRLERTCHYHLLAVEDASLEDVTAILSHAEAFADCAAHLMQLTPQAQWVQTASTGAAARRVAAEASRTNAAIAPAAAAELYGLKLLASTLEDDPNNRTTWAVIGPKD